MENFDQKILTKKCQIKKKKKKLSIGVSQPIWGMPAKIWGSRPAGLGGDRD
jgi:hypothetical protein